MKSATRRVIWCAAAAASTLTITAVYAAEPFSADDLLRQAASGMQCEEIPNNGRHCSYRFGDYLVISIKGVGGPDMLVGFQRSDINAKLYAVLYRGCIAVVPGMAHPHGYKSDYAIFISPESGRVSQSIEECQSIRKAR